MPLRRNQNTTYILLDSFWNRKIRGIIATFPSNEKHWPIDPEYLKKQIYDFAQKDPINRTVTEKFNTILEKIILTITPSGVKSERFMLVVEPRNAFANFYATYNTDWGQEYDTSVYSFNCNIEATLKNIDAFLRKFPKYHEQAQNLRLSQEKENKLIDIAEKSIETIIPQIMSSSNYEWYLSSDETRYLLFVKMKKHKMIQISLTPKNFSGKISGILNVIAQIEKLLDQIPYAVDIKSYGNKIPWKKGAKLDKLQAETGV
ncbi:hypothetical protein [Fibrobacter sp. UWB5]|uniref:hypothetical protein n=1 Tax=Fibrobacter sp. UWB5 TaxID=1964360 RepID=UPI000B527A9B|nr:hypothetical protein [Fibrobacter sp. UWB5]OWV14119.1 hypothetical protein B7989_01220 [Fibrobacter sp. UWB5]